MSAIANSIVTIVAILFSSSTLGSRIEKWHPRTEETTAVEIWALQAFSMMDAHSCRQLYIFEQSLCEKVKQATHRTQMNLYVSNNGRVGNYTVLYPDNALRHDPTHNLVLAIDPFPQLSIPHILFLFFLDKISPNQCEHKSGQFHNNYCLYLAQKKQCAHDLNSYCQLRYLPLVYDNNDNSSVKSQLFKCHEDILVTASCPRATELNKKQSVCEQDAKSAACAKSSVTNLCQKDIICDYGFIISAGWNEINARESLETGTVAMYNQLKKQGFHEDSIRILINNATTFPRSSSRDPQVIWGAQDRAEMRSSIRKVCNSDFCADTVVIYMSGLTSDDGSLMLWDLDKDGIVDKKERYSTFHLLKDTAHCKANRVILIVDSTNTETLIRKVSANRAKGTHKNMIVVGAGRFGQLPDDTFVKVFTQFSGMQFCLAEALLDVERHSSLEPILMLPQGSSNVNVTLTGASCNRHSNFPTKTSGCMQLPSMMWKLFT